MFQLSCPPHESGNLSGWAQDEVLGGGGANHPADLRHDVLQSAADA